MLRYKKHKRIVDGLGESSVGVMDDTDMEVSSFTDRAFRSLCVAEEEPYNDVPHLPSPIGGMPISNKYHLGIFNLSVRKTQPLAQLPTISGHRGKWAPTFQPLLNCRREGMFNVKTNTNKLCAPEPREYKQRSKVSSLIKTFDNIENERPEDSPIQSKLPLIKSSQTALLSAEDDLICGTNLQDKIKNEQVVPSKQEEIALHDSTKLHRRTARDVFLESQADNCFKHSRSPCSLGSPRLDKKMLKEPSRKTSFLHSENSAFKSWSDIHQKVGLGEDSDCSLPGTPPVFGYAASSSPLLSRMIPGIRAREAGAELGWTSPASTASSSYDAVQMLRSVPPLPSKRAGKQGREYKSRLGTQKVQQSHMIQEEEMQIDVVCPSSKELVSWTDASSINKLKSPIESIEDQVICKSPDTVTNVRPPPIEQNEVKAKDDSSKLKMESGEIRTDKASNSLVLSEHIPSQGRIKNLIQQIEKETVEKTVGSVSPDSNPPPQAVSLVPPWRRKKVIQNLESEKEIMPAAMDINDSAKASHVLTIEKKEELLQEKPTSSSFNITNLLTPVITRKKIQEVLEELPMAITPPPAEILVSKEQDPKEVSMYRNRDDYKSKATGLLFNLKDMRKRVKSTYSPAPPVRHLKENNIIAEARIQEDANVIQKEISTVKPSLRKSRQGESEKKTDIHGNAADNYLSLSSPEMAFYNKTETIPEEISGSGISHKLEQNVINTKDCLPNFNQKNYTGANINFTEKNHKVQSPEEPEEPVLLSETISETTCNNCGESLEVLDVHGNDVLDKNTTAISLNQGVSNPQQQLDRHFENKDKEKLEKSKVVTKDDLQYYAVNSCVDQSVNLETDIANKGDEKAMESEKLFNEKACDDELQRPEPSTMFKPNLFHIKDNKVLHKSSPVTRSVRLPLLRSFSEDSLAFRKGDVLIHSDNRGPLREAEKNDIYLKDNKDDENTDICSKGKVREVMGIRPASEIPKQIAFDSNFVKTHKEDTGNLDVWKKLCSINFERRKNKIEKAEISKLQNSSLNISSTEPELHFFHPVETCISEVTGPSPECNTLLFQDVNNSIKDMVNGEAVDSPQTDTALYSPLENGLLQFEDSVAFTEDIVCSTITSPMSESVTCSMVASPMSVNTQSSGFATALSTLEDVPSPTASVNTKHGEIPIPPPEKPIPALDGVMETQTVDNSKYQQEKVPIVEPQNIKAILAEPQNLNSAKPPAVPPKTEKALRRAKRLTKKRRKTELPHKMQDGEYHEAELVLDVPSPGNVTPTLMTQPMHIKPSSCTSSILEEEASISASSTPSLPATQRKLLQDPDSGQYFVVDIPVHVRIKTFYDPETGKYLQVSLPTSEMETPSFEVLSSPFMMYPGLPPVPVSSISLLKGNSQALDQLNMEKPELRDSWEERDDTNSLKGQKYIDSICDSCDQSMTGTPQSMDRIPSRSRSPDIISIKDLDEFAIEAIS
ncbi:cardiac-enriched FHL2-interacting protein isoform X2 [Xenopus laevis]|uniref:Cardiac-enriched FHL2-interacting protein isoform X2 n=1 Tax=Xenopus laevis TaxID=8355 RepID=A0A8J1L8X4_XENLA|nr:cardiac-enriched FHL2-interacting protein isoform X2 [Xenopus laevis]